jgi:hypothetical protein
MHRSADPFGLRCFTWLCLWGVAAGFCSRTADALDVVEMRWGFDGKVVRQRFMPLSILVNHPLPTAFEGEMRLTKRMANGSQVDAPLIESVFVSPFGERWVQFYPYCANDWGEEFVLEVFDNRGRLVQALDVPKARTGWPARVIIDTGKSAARKNTPLKRLPEQLFPPFITALDGLQVVFFDGVPDWDEPRRQAFLDWLHLGGTAYVMKGSDDSVLAFPAGLAALNSPLDETTVGAGRIFRLDYTRAQADAAILTNALARVPARLIIKADGTAEKAPVLDATDTDDNGSQQYQDAGDPLASTSFLQRLRKMTKVEHNWPLLHLLFWIYIGLIFPGCYLAGRKWTDYRTVYLALLGTVAVFSVLFGLVGRRGYGEASAVHSIALARVLPDGQADVSQWSNTFVTSGGDYSIKHAGQGTLYATCNSNEAVRRWIRNGAEAEFLADIPPFSSREFAHRMRVPLPVPKFRVIAGGPSPDGLRGVVIATEGTLPPKAEMNALLYGDSFYTVQHTDGKITVGGKIGTVPGYLRVQDFNNWQHNFGGGWGQQDQTTEQRFREMFTPLISRSLNVKSPGDADAVLLPPHTARLFYFAPMTDEFMIRNPYLGRQEGWVLYTVDLTWGQPQ